MRIGASQDNAQFFRQRWKHRFQYRFIGNLVTARQRHGQNGQNVLVLFLLFLFLGICIAIGQMIVFIAAVVAAGQEERANKSSFSSLPWWCCGLFVAAKLALCLR